MGSRRLPVALVGLAVVGLAVAALVCACAKKTTQQGGLEVIIATNLHAPADFDSVEVLVSQQTSSAGAGQWTSLFDNTFMVPAEATLPTTFSVAAGTSPDQVVLIGVAALKNGKPVALRQAQLQVPTDRVAALTMILAESCYGQVQTIAGLPAPTCPAGQSCQPAYGKCGPTIIDSSTLPSYTSGMVAAVDAGSPDATLPDASDSGTGLMDSAIVSPDSGGNTTDGGTESGPPQGCDGGVGDPLNCGAPGYSCQGGSCLCGVCQPVVLYTGADGGPGASGPIAVDSANVYFCDNYGCDSGMCGFVYKLPKAGGVATPLAQVGFCEGLVVDANRVYWTDAVSNDIAAVPIDGGSAATLATGNGQPWAIAVDLTHVYFTDIGDGSIRRVALDGGAPQALSVGATLFPEGIAVDGTGVYWTDHNAGSSGAWMAPLDGGAVTTIPPFLAAGGYGAGIAVGGGSLFWAQDVPDGSVQGASEIGSPNHVYATLNQANPYGVAADVAGFYWTLYDANGGIGTTPRDAGSTATLATGQSYPQYIAIDSTSIYWTTTTTVMKLAKP